MKKVDFSVFCTIILSLIVVFASACVDPSDTETTVELVREPPKGLMTSEIPSMSDRGDFQALDTRVWIVLDRTYIWRTADGGKTWTKVHGSTSGKDHGTSGGLSFYDPDNGFAVLGGKLLKTADGGRSWAVIADMDVGVKAIFFADGALGWATGSEAKGEDDEIPGLFEVGRVWKTEDGGRTWKRMKVAPPKELLAAGYHKWELRDIHFSDRSTGWVAGRGTLYRTNDGGRTWNPQPIGRYVDVSKIHFVNPNIGWFQNVTGGFYVSRNGGTTWEELKLPEGLSYENSAIAVNKKSEWIYLSEYGRLYRAEDGNVWKEIPYPHGEWSEMSSRSNGGYAYASTTFDGSSLLIWVPYEDGKPMAIMSFVR